MSTTTTTKPKAAPFEVNEHYEHLARLRAEDAERFDRSFSFNKRLALDKYLEAKRKAEGNR